MVIDPLTNRTGSINIGAMDIQEIRTKLGMTQAQFAAKLGVAVQTVNRWENSDRRPTKALLRQIGRLERKAQKNV